MNSIKAKWLLTLLSGTGAGLYPVLSSALGLGDIQVDSRLNQTLRARIEIVGVSDEEWRLIRASIAAQSLSSGDVAHPELLDSVALSPFEDADHRHFIQVKSSSVFTEPLFDLPIEVSDQSTHVVRSYAVLLDPEETVSAAQKAAESNSGRDGAVAAASNVNHDGPVTAAVTAPQSAKADSTAVAAKAATAKHHTGRRHSRKHARSRRHAPSATLASKTAPASSTTSALSAAQASSAASVSKSAPTSPHGTGAEQTNMQASGSARDQLERQLAMLQQALAQMQSTIAAQDAEIAKLSRMVDSGDAPAGPAQPAQARPGEQAQAAKQSAAVAPITVRDAAGQSAAVAPTTVRDAAEHSTAVAPTTASDATGQSAAVTPTTARDAAEQSVAVAPTAARDAAGQSAAVAPTTAHDAAASPARAPAATQSRSVAPPAPADSDVDAGDETEPPPSFWHRPGFFYWVAAGLGLTAALAAIGLWLARKRKERAVPVEDRFPQSDKDVPRKSYPVEKASSYQVEEHSAGANVASSANTAAGEDVDADGVESWRTQTALLEQDVLSATNSLPFVLDEKNQVEATQTQAIPAIGLDDEKTLELQQTLESLEMQQTLESLEMQRTMEMRQPLDAQHTVEMRRTLDSLKTQNLEVTRKLQAAQNPDYSETNRDVVKELEHTLDIEPGRVDLQLKLLEIYHHEALGNRDNFHLLLSRLKVEQETLSPAQRSHLEMLRRTLEDGKDDADSNCATEAAI